MDVPDSVPNSLFLELLQKHYGVKISFPVTAPDSRS